MFLAIKFEYGYLAKNTLKGFFFKMIYAYQTTNIRTNVQCKAANLTQKIRAYERIIIVMDKYGYKILKTRSLKMLGRFWLLSPF